jgi:hypothetical protein
MAGSANACRRQHRMAPSFVLPVSSEKRSIPCAGPIDDVPSPAAPVLMQQHVFEPCGRLPFDRTHREEQADHAHCHPAGPRYEDCQPARYLIGGASQCCPLKEPRAAMLGEAAFKEHQVSSRPLPTAHVSRRGYQPLISSQVQRLLPQSEAQRALEISRKAGGHDPERTSRAVAASRPNTAETVESRRGAVTWASF